MDLVRFFLKYSRKSMVLSLIAGCLSGASNAALLAIINSVLKHNGSYTAALAWGFVGLSLFLPLSRFVSEFLLSRIGQGALYSLRMELSRQILGAPLRYLEKIGAPAILAVLTEDLPNITNTILTIPLLCINVAVVIGCLVYMGYLSWPLLIVVLAFMAIGIISYSIPVLKAQSLFRLARKDSDVMQQHFRALTHGAKELKAHRERRYEFLNNALEATADSFRHNNVSAMKTYSAAASWGQTLVFVVVGLIIFILPKIQHLDGLTLTGYAIALLYLMTPLQVTMNVIPTLGRGNVALNRVKELGFSLGRYDSEEVAGPAIASSWKTLRFDSVTHSYSQEGEPNSFVLGPLNLSFQPGELVFIIGGNGSGKTTFAKLLTGLYVPEGGTVSIDGQSVDTKEARERYRQYFSSVFSDFYLFNELMGINDSGLDGRAADYLNILKLSHKVQIANRKLSTVDLSQGQRKRLALLTAYLEDRPVYLFDEWAADQDPYFKNIFYTQLLPELKAKGKTVFVISHDDRYYEVADRLIKLEDGQVVWDSLRAQDEDLGLAPPAKAVET
ncbi:MAG TPA: cyclic peptide export ABC transporter [Candidatus Angelobacter sp.]|jgi:putative ATP-binding cassette transporter|nr:cyclic peptide export ABC transporter [Candidatus Angelobacter sp.]